MNDRYCGVLCVDKPQGFTSFDVVAKVRGIARTRRIGHAGTLDPMATGVLPLFLGRATKAVDLLPQQGKRYTAVIQLGLETDTWDVTGRELCRRPVEVSPEQLHRALDRYRGEFSQLPPMYSAVQVGGKRLYELARKGLEVERAPRTVRIDRLDLLDWDGAAGRLTLDVACSKGTYIRSLAQDLGRDLGCGGTLAALRRTWAVGFGLEQCVTLEQLEQAAGEERLEELLLPVEQVFQSLPQVGLKAKEARLFCNGVRLELERVGVSAPEGTRLSVYGPSGQFLAVAQAEEGQLRMIKQFLLGGEGDADLDRPGRGCL